MICASVFRPLRCSEGIRFRSVRYSSFPQVETFQGFGARIPPNRAVDGQEGSNSPATMESKHIYNSGIKSVTEKCKSDQLSKGKDLLPEYVLNPSIVQPLDAKALLELIKSVEDFDELEEHLRGIITSNLQAQLSPTDICKILETFSKRKVDLLVLENIFREFGNRITSDSKFLSSFSIRDIISTISLFDNQKVLSSKLFKVLLERISYLLPWASSNDFAKLLNVVSGTQFENDILAVVGDYIVKRSVKLGHSAITALCACCAKSKRNMKNVGLVRYTGELICSFPFLLPRFDVKGLAIVLDALTLLRVNNQIAHDRIISRLKNDADLITNGDAESLSKIANAICSSDSPSHSILKRIANRIAGDKILISQFTPEQLSQTLSAFSRYRVDYRRVFDVIGNYILKEYSTLDYFKPNDIALTVNALCKPEVRNLPVFELIATRIITTPGIVNQFSPKSIIIFLDSYLKASVRHLVLFNLFSTAIVNHPTLYKDFTSADIANLFSICSKLGVKNFEMYLKLTPKNTDFLNYHPSHTTQILHSLAAVNMIDHHYFTLFLSRVASDPEYLKDFTPRQIPTLLHVFLKVNPKNELFEVVEGLILSNPSILATYPAAQVPTLLNSFSKKGNINSMLLNLLAERLLFDEIEFYDSLTPQDLCMLIYDFSNLGYRNVQLFKSLGDCVIQRYSQRLSEFTPLGIANILNGFHRVDIRHNELFMLLLREITQRQNFFDSSKSPPTTLFKILYAVKAAGIKSKPLYDTVAKFLDRKENRCKFNALREEGLETYVLI